MTNPYHYLRIVHDYLMKVGIPYHGVSVIHRPQDLGYHCIFANKGLMTEEIKAYLKGDGIGFPEFTYSFNNRELI